jgi:hypothetical protein
MPETSFDGPDEWADALRADFQRRAGNRLAIVDLLAPPGGARGALTASCGNDIRRRTENNP